MYVYHHKVLLWQKKTRLINKQNIETFSPTKKEGKNCKKMTPVLEPLTEKITVRVYIGNIFRYLFVDQTYVATTVASKKIKQKN